MKTEKIENTPFTIVSEIEEIEEIKDQSYITIGNNIVYVGKNENDCRMAIKNYSWELLINTASLVAVKSTEKYLQENNDQQKTESNENKQTDLNR